MSPWRKRIILPLFIFSMIILNTLYAQTSFSWNGGSANWTDASQWTPNGVPASSDTAIISSGTVTVDSDVTVAQLRFLGGRIIGGEQLTINDIFAWQSGTLEADTTTVLAGAAFTISGPFGKTLRRPLVNHTTCIWTGTSISMDNSAGRFINENLFDIRTDQSMGSLGQVINNGTLKKSAGTAETTISADFINNGEVQVEAGTLRPSDVSSGPGSYDISSGAKYQLNGGTHTFDGNTLAGDGTFEVVGGTININGAGLIFPESINFPFLGGTIQGDGPIDVNGIFSWQSGTLTGSDTVRVNATSTFTISGPFGKTLRRPLVNYSTCVWTGTSISMDIAAARFINESLFDIQTDQAIGSLGQVINNGTLKKSVGTAETTISADFINNGEVQVETGTLRPSDVSSGPGSYDISSAAKYQLNGGTHTFDGNTLTGDGTFEIVGGTININGAGLILPVSINFPFLGGTIQGDGPIDINGIFSWQSGTLTGSDTVRVNATATFTISGPFGKTLRRPLVNHTSCIWTGTSISMDIAAARFINESLFDIQTDQAIGSLGLVINNGTLKKSVGTAETTISADFINNGEVQVETGTLRPSDVSSGPGSYDISSAAKYQLNGGTHTFDGNTLTGDGTFEIVGGTININGAGLIFPESINFPFLGGTIQGDGPIDINGIFSWQSGTLTGSDSVRVNATATFTISGPFGKTLRRPLVNHSTCIWTGTSISMDNAAGRFINESLFDIQTDQAIGSLGLVINNGTLKKSVGSGETTISADLINNGEVQVEAGTLRPSDVSSGPGSYDISSAAKYKLNGGTHTFDGNTLAGDGTFEVVGGVININGAGLIFPESINFPFLGGTIQGDGPIDINGIFSWQSGTLTGSDTVRVNATATFTISGPFGKTLRRPLVNHTTCVWTGTSISMDNAAGRFINESLFDIQTDQTIGSLGLVINNGTLKKSVGSGETTISADLINNGEIQVETGTLRPSDESSGSGSYDIRSAAKYKMSGSTHTFDGNTLTGEGIFEISGGTININGAGLNFPVTLNFQFLGGTIQGSGPIAVNGIFNWQSGTITGSDTVTVGATATFTISSNFGKNLRRPLVNQATCTWTGTSISMDGGGARFINEGVFDIRTDNTMGSLGSVINSGTMKKTAGTATTNISADLINTGIISAEAAILRSSDLMLNDTSGVIQGSATFQKNSDVFTNYGTIAPGLSPGILNFVGDFLMFPSANMDIELGGYAPGSEYDRLTSSGNAFFNNNLNVSFINNFVPAIGDTFTFVTYNSRNGTFDNINLPGGYEAQVIYGVNRAYLEITHDGGNRPPSAPQLQAPANGTTLSNFDDPINFQWSEAIDPDGDAIDYALRIWGPAVDTTFNDISSTTFSYQPVGLEPLRSYQWTVSASDDIFIVPADTFAFNTPIGALQGIYTIGSGGDFNSFNNAANILNTYGVFGPVTFQVLPGDYSEIFEIHDFPGHGPDNPVTFESQSGDAADVNITFQQTFEHLQMVLVDSTENIHFRHLTFNVIDSNYDRNNIFYLRNSDNVSIEDCILNGTDDAIAFSTNNSIISLRGNDIRVLNNEFNLGGVAVRLIGVNDSTLSSGAEIKGNTFNEPFHNAIGCEDLDAPVIEGNNISKTQPSSAFPIILSNCDNALRLVGNQLLIDQASGTLTTIGLAMSDCDGDSSRGLIANNFINVFAGDSSWAAFGASISRCTNLDFFYNTVNLANYRKPKPPVTGSGSAFNVSVNCDDLVLKNNIFSTTAGGVAFGVLFNSTNIEADYNNYYSASAQLATIGGTAVPNLDSLRVLTGGDLHSLSTPPCYLAPDDLHVAAAALDGAGIPIPEITVDVDGDPRDPSTPDIGADEFLPSEVGLSGTYSIGSSGEYLTFNDAIEDLHLRCVSGPVIFNVENGVYTEKLYIREIAGASAANTITFQSASGNQEDVVFDYNALNTSGELIHLEGADHIIFKNMTMNVINAHFALSVVRLAGDADGNKFINNVMSIEPSRYIIWATEVSADSNVIDGNTMTNGGIYMKGVDDSTLMRANQIKNNRINSDFVFNLYLENHDSPLISGNTIAVVDTPDNPFSGNAFGMLLTNCDNRLEITKNRISVFTSGHSRGIYLIDCDGGTERGLIANNFVHVHGDSALDGIGIIIGQDFLEGASQLDFYHNSVHVTGINTRSSWALGSTAEVSDIRMQNNIFANKEGGQVYNVSNTSAFTSLDYNNLYTSGDTLAIWDGAQLTLGDLQTASGMESNSVSGIPGFVSDSDLHLRGSSVASNSGTPISEVADDIDGHTRNASTPDIGADEYTVKRVVIKRRTRLRLPIFSLTRLRVPIRISFFPDTDYEVLDVNVSIDTLLHDNVDDLEITLVHEGVTDTLVYQIGSDGDNFIGTVLDDSATTPLSSGSPPYSGLFLPYQPLAQFNGVNPEGEWVLEIFDQGLNNTGRIDAWSLEVTYGVITDITPDENRPQLPEKFALKQNYPNPFNPSTTIEYAVPQTAHVRISIYNVLGERVAVLRDEVTAPGVYQTRWEAGTHASGVYFYQMQTTEYTVTRKMLLMR